MFHKYIKDLEDALENAQEAYSAGDHSKANEALKDAFRLLKLSPHYLIEIEINYLHGNATFAQRMNNAKFNYFDLINKVYFAKSNNLLRLSNRLIDKKEFQQAGVLLGMAKEYVNTLHIFYETALQDGLTRIPAYLDFPKDIEHLERNLCKVQNKHSQAFAIRFWNDVGHFSENQAALGLDRANRALPKGYRNRYEFHPSTQHLRDDNSLEESGLKLG